MKLNRNIIKEYYKKENILALCNLVPLALMSKNETYINDIENSIESILDIWLYDFFSFKNGDPSDYPYVEGLEALQNLNSKRDIRISKVDYLICCGNYYKTQNEIIKATSYYNKAEVIAKNMFENDNEDAESYSKLMYIYSNFPTQNIQEKEINLNQALNLMAYATSIDYPEKFYISNIFLLCRDYDVSADMMNRIIEIRKEFIAKCYIQAKHNPLFAFNFNNNLIRCLANNKYTSFIEVDTVSEGFLELAMPIGDFIDKNEPSIQWRTMLDAGHIFLEKGISGKREDFLLVAEDLFNRILKSKHYFSLLHVYIANVKKARADLLFENGNFNENKIMKDNICNYYLDNWKDNKDISYLSNAIKYLTDSFLQDSNLLIKSSPHILNEIINMALTAEEQGRGGYWFPYEALFILNLEIGDLDNAKLWLAKGYRSLNILAEKEIKSLDTLVKKRYSKQASDFLHKIIYHLDNKLDKSFWSGSPPYDQTLIMTIDDFNKWLDN